MFALLLSFSICLARKPFNCHKTSLSLLLASKDINAKLNYLIRLQSASHSIDLWPLFLIVLAPAASILWPWLRRKLGTSNVFLLGNEIRPIQATTGIAIQCDVGNRRRRHGQCSCWNSGVACNEESIVARGRSRGSLLFARSSRSPHMWDNCWKKANGNSHRIGRMVSLRQHAQSLGIPQVETPIVCRQSSSKTTIS